MNGYTAEVMSGSTQAAANTVSMPSTMSATPAGRKSHHAERRELQKVGLPGPCAASWGMKTSQTA